MKKGLLSIKLLICLLGAVWSAAALKLYFAIEKDTEPLQFLLREGNPLFWLLPILLLTFLYWKRKAFCWKSCVPAMLLTMLYTAGTILDYKSFAPVGNYAKLMVCMIPGTLLFFDTVIGFLLSFQPKEEAYGKVFSVYQKSPVLITMGVLLLFWSPWLIFYFPGTLPFDGNFQLNMYFGLIPFTGHHPPLSTYLMGWLITLGQALGSASIGIFLHTAIQTLLLSFSMALVIRCFFRFGISKWMIAVTVLFFGLFPFFPIYAQAFMKDTVFTALFLLYTLLLMAFFKEKQSTIPCIAFFFTALLLMLFRNNGMFVVLFTAVGCLFIKTTGKKQWIFISALAIAINFGINNFLWPSLGIGEGSKGEILSIPLQQTARYVKEYEEEITPEEQKEISKVLEYEGLGERYNPFLADPVKNTYIKDASGKDLIDFFQVWFRLYQKHPSVFWASFGDSTYPYWYPAVRGEPLLAFQLYPYNQGESAVTANHTIDAFSSLRKKIREGLKSLAQTKGINLIFRPGLYFWCLVLLAWRMVIQKKGKQLILLIPCATIWLTNIASPVSGSTRYTLPIMITLPLLIGILVWKRSVFPKE
ncbi:MAG: hypothetical protein E7399_09425 [Ruminococcaceae bacterium]|nr:hypothetical protein [Oscillospiraceae bacterium]